MSAARKSYYRRRRDNLRRRHICTRCGSARARAGHTTCAACEVEKKMKRPEPIAAAIRREKRRQQLAALLDEARASILRKFENVV